MGARRVLRCGALRCGALRCAAVRGRARIMASAVDSARKCDMVSSPTLARPMPPVMARTVGPAPER